MEANRQSASRIRVPIAWKFFLLIGVVVPSVLAVSAVGVRALGSMKQRLDTVYEDALNSARTIGQLSTAVEEAEEMSRLLVAETQASPIRRTTSELRRGAWRGGWTRPSSDASRSCGSCYAFSSGS